MFEHMLFVPQKLIDLGLYVGDLKVQKLKLIVYVGQTNWSVVLQISSAPFFKH